MKTLLCTMAAFLLLTACGQPESGCAECEKMAREAKAEHDAKMAAQHPHNENCECCKGKH